MSNDRGKWVPGRIRPGWWVFLVIIVLLLLAAWNTGTNLLYVILGMAVSLWILSVVFSRLSFRGFSMSRDCPPAVYRGDPVPVTLRITNRKRLFPLISVRIAHAPLKRFRRNAPPLGHIVNIPARHTALLAVQEAFLRRGVHTLPPYDLVSTFPFGLTERRRRFADALQVVVYPRVRPVRIRAVEHAIGGRTAARRSLSEGDEYFSLREYEPGDEIRYIAWRLSARLGALMVRELAAESSRSIAIILDTRWAANTEQDEELFEDAVDLTASLAISLLYRQYTIAVITPSGSVTPGAGSMHHRKVLDLLANVQPVPPDAYPGFDLSAIRHELQESRVIFVSPDPQRWGSAVGPQGVRVLDPGDVVYA